MRRCSLMISEPDRKIKQDCERQLVDPVTYNPGSVPLVGSLVYYRRRKTWCPKTSDISETTHKLVQRKSKSYPNLSSKAESREEAVIGGRGELQPNIPDRSCPTSDTESDMDTLISKPTATEDDSFSQLEDCVDHQRRRSSGWVDNQEYSNSIPAQQVRSSKHQRRLTCAVMFTKPRLLEI
ncbi:hypothetical protein OGAPHI_001920 [Ogataea philodendri]|uniref:Uncharacterized protein n=1 Tax=Ogataea philodendri TaxID=1378263 RepID=A0A9P8T7P1_9ASCO|nr:uncharacterized protein OGAPHI_001920 [Ogataea philodendri]KAH3668166.1 hypothetical protein OGAPHI_001920 [Ogataea philodendri]